MKILLASSSRRRFELLKTLGYEVVIVSPNIDEVDSGEHLNPHDIALKNAVNKARHVYKEQGLKGADLLLGADTVVVLERTVFGKPKDRDDAVRILQKLSNRAHEVITSYCLMNTDGREVTRTVTSNVSFRNLTFQEITSYLLRDEWQDKAGAYGVQGMGASLIREVKGSITNVIGLPLEEFITDAYALIEPKRNTKSKLG